MKKTYKLIVLIILLFILSINVFGFEKKTIPSESIEYYQDILKYGTINEIKNLLNKLIIYQCDPLVNELIELFKSTNNVQIKTSIMGLIKDIESAKKQIIPLLIEILDDKFSDNALIKMAIISCGELNVLQLENKIYEYFIDEKYESETQIRIACIDALGKMKGTKHFDDLFIFLEDTTNDDTLRAQAALYYSNFDMIDKKYIEKMNEIIIDKAEDKYVRRYIIHCLGKYKDPSSFDYLKQALSSEDPYIQLYAAQALKSYGFDKASDEIIKLIRSNNEKIRVEVLDMFKEANALEFIDVVVYKAMHDDSNPVRAKAREVFLFLLEKNGRPKVDQSIQDKIYELLTYIEKYDPIEENRKKAESLIEKHYKNYMTEKQKKAEELKEKKENETEEENKE